MYSSLLHTYGPYHHTIHCTCCHNAITLLRRITDRTWIVPSCRNIYSTIVPDLWNFRSSPRKYHGLQLGGHYAAESCTIPFCCRNINLLSPHISAQISTNTKCCNLCQPARTTVKFNVVRVNSLWYLTPIVLDLHAKNKHLYERGTYRWTQQDVVRSYRWSSPDVAV